ncbi:MAG: hypothetical protein KME46_22035 [Brasilonema angustatum HA4187-MV1]|jgi:hypothetical protein|nr:hypothetical protein [Brasilonema angustatum HA4187-MV1]
MASINYSAKALTVDDIEKAIKELQDLKKSKEREAREAQEKLPSDARRKVLIGVAVLEAQKRGFITEDFLQEVLDKFLTKNKDRAVFDLASRETEGDKQQRGRPKKEKTADTQASQSSVVEPTPEHSPEPIPVVTETEDKEVATVAATTDNKPAAKRVATAQRKTSKSSKKQDEWDLK